jgi:nitrogen regulatory protein PII
MKLVMIMSVSEQTDQLQDLLVRQGVPAFSQLEMKGVKTGLPIDESDNWFAHDRLQALSNMTLAVVNDEKAAELMKAIHRYSATLSSANPLHAFQFNVEHFI